MAVCSEIHTKHINTLWAERGTGECQNLVVQIVTTLTTDPVRTAQ